MITEQTNNTFGTTSTSTEEAVASTGNQSHAQPAVVQETAVNQPVQQQATTQEGYQPGPDQVLAQYRRDLEASQREVNEARAQLADPEVARFLEFQKTQKAQAEADRFGTSPELLNELNALKQSQAYMIERQNTEAAQAGFQSFATDQAMPEPVQQEFLGYLERVLPTEMQDLAMRPGFNFEPYVHGFAAMRGANQATANAANANTVTYVPGQPSGQGATSDAAKMKAYIQELVKKG